MKLFILFQFLFWAVAALPQQPPANPPNLGPTIDPQTREEKDPLPPGDMVRKARLRALIETETSDFTKLKKTALQMRELTESLSKQVESTQAVRISAPKTLREIEKLAKEVLSKSGGSKVTEENPDFPQELLPACRLLAEYASHIDHDLQQGSRFIVSANVVKYSNNLLTLVRYLQKNF